MYWVSKGLTLRKLTVPILVALAAFVSPVSLLIIFNLINGTSCGMFSGNATAMAPNTQSTKICSTSTATYIKLLLKFFKTLWKALRLWLCLRTSRRSYSSK